jgi:hypothetical protein
MWQLAQFAAYAVDPAAACSDVKTGDDLAGCPGAPPGA